MDYFQLIPTELIEILISFLNNDSLDSFIQCYSFNSLNLYIVFKYHFGYHKNVNLSEYKRYLGLETLKDKLKLKQSIEELSNLDKLYLNNNQLTSLPKEIGNLTSLQTLYLGDNQLTSLPGEIGNLTSLQRLDLYNNQLTSLPKEIGNLTSLYRLDLSDNQLNKNE